MFTNYRYVVTDSKVIAISKFAGKPVRGIAKCNPNDHFDESKGKELAAARCNSKVAAKRYKRAMEKYDTALEEFRKAEARLEQMKNYVNDSEHALDLAYDEEYNLIQKYS